MCNLALDWVNLVHSELTLGRNITVEGHHGQTGLVHSGWKAEELR